LTKARDIADFKFENIVDVGTEGTKLATGTTAQRGSTQGQLRFNSTTGKFEGRGLNSFVTIEPSPVISSVDVTEVASAAGGDQTFVITGENFSAGDTASFVGSDGTEVFASSTTIDSATQITAVIAKSSFVDSKEPYDVKIAKSTGTQGSLADQINVDNDPNWTTAAGNIASIPFNNTGTHATVVATDPEGDTISYSVVSGSLPTGTSLDSANGQITGTITNPGSPTTYTFTVRATANSKTSDRQFNIQILTTPGSAQSYPASNAAAIKTADPNITNGAYWITVDGTAKQVYCDFDGTYTGDSSNSYMLYQAFGSSYSSLFTGALDDIYTDHLDVLNSASGGNNNPGGGWNNDLVTNAGSYYYGVGIGVGTDNFYFYAGGGSGHNTQHQNYLITTPAITRIAIKGGGGNSGHGNVAITVSGAGQIISSGYIQTASSGNVNTSSGTFIDCAETGSSIGRLYYIFVG
tara:strand:- start:955 stop:2349 length:1395 start_codon:yes stop_codon:yes gene_type:complete